MGIKTPYREKVSEARLALPLGDLDGGSDVSLLSTRELHGTLRKIAKIMGATPNTSPIA